MIKKKVIILGIAGVFIWISSYSQTAQSLKKPPVSSRDSGSVNNSRMTYKIINAPHNTFGYDISVNGALAIHQPAIPGLPGMDGFKTKTDAQKVAKLVMSKMKKGEMPPTVNSKELKRLKVIK